MRVLIINPNSDQETADVLYKTAGSFLEGRGEFDVVSMKTAPKLVVTYEDQAASAAELIATGRGGSAMTPSSWPAMPIRIWTWSGR